MERMILITGATGNVGSQVVRELVRRGVRVRAFVRDPGRARTILGERVELAVGDLGEPGTIRSALEGVDRLFLACGNVPDQVDLEGNAIEAAVAAGVERVVKLSAAAADPASPLLFPRWQGRIEKRLGDTGIPSVILHPLDYMTNVLGFAEMVTSTGAIRAPLGGARTGMVHPRDVAAVGAVALTGEGHEGRTYVLSGPEVLTYERIAAELSRATGRSVRFEDVADEDAHRQMLERGTPPFLADFLIALSGAMRDGLVDRVTHAVQALTGRPPTNFADFADEHAALFRPR